MEYIPTKPVNLPLAEFMALEFYLMDNRPGVKPELFVTELVKRWLAVENERLALRRDGAALTPSQFANQRAKGRNVWRFVWLRFPGNERWVRADDCRVRPHRGGDRHASPDHIRTGSG
ncbi:hypothetical protein IP92_04170 [Pseudoduganella flava]|uniref:Uncharacterized protein n=1 Tax=Pseudoduganella flava TaxID=871742 RepID=A0A562PKJ0_9BURK|nr:hypothetical protein [Pseudoduganella flava]TWI44995.1 hypothetical protein IP92_04170 [Pseudoduganella flava]